MRPTASSTAPEPAESSATRMSHAGEPMVTPHLRIRTAANSAEGTAIPARILAFKTLRAETLPRLGS